MVKEGFNFDGYTECAMEFDKYIRWRRFPRGLIGIRFENSRFIADFVAILGINYGNTYAYVATKSQYGYNFCYVNDPFWKKSKSLQRIDKWRCSVWYGPYLDSTSRTAKYIQSIWIDIKVIQAWQSLLSSTVKNQS